MSAPATYAHRGTVVSVALSLLFAAAVGLQTAQAPETISADATVKSAGGVKASAPVVVAIKRYSTDADRDALVAAVKKGGTAARDLLAKRDDLGTVQVGGRQTPIKHAYARSTGGGRLISVVTAVPIVFIGGGLPDAKAKEGFDFGLVILDTAASGGGKGELVPATKISVNADGAVVTQDYSGEVVTLSNVTRK
jgi:hypothetical protein